MPPVEGFSDEQKNFLQGFAMGSDVARAVRGLPVLSGSGSPQGTTVSVGGGSTAATPSASVATAGPFPLQVEAQDRFLAQGKALAAEEKAKRDKDPFSMWDEMGANSAAGVYPKGNDVFLYKFSGLFQVAPAQNSFMSRLRIPGGVLPPGSSGGSPTWPGGMAAGTSTARPGPTSRSARSRPRTPATTSSAWPITGSSAEVRAPTTSATARPRRPADRPRRADRDPAVRPRHAPLHPQPPRDVRPPAQVQHRLRGRGPDRQPGRHQRHRLQGREGPRGRHRAPRRGLLPPDPGGITGHKDFARDTGVLLKPEECVEVAGAIVRVYLKNGDRTDRKKARLKYVLDAWGFPRFIEEVEKEVGRPLGRVDLALCEASTAEDRWAHVGFHPQKQPGQVYVGVVLPVGRMTSEQAEGLAEIAERHGSRTIRLTVWQNLLIPDIAEADVDAVKLAIEAIGLHWDASSVRSGLIACTGNAGCKFAGADTKRNAMEIAAYLEGRVTLDRPINIHVTGCPNSCAQHYIGDIGLQGTQVEVEEEMVEGYHLVVGGGWGLEQGAGRPLLESLPFEKIPPIIERLIVHYLANRVGPDESFAAFARRHDVEALRAVAAEDLAVA